MTLDLPLIWVLIIAFGLMMYVVMDGFDLGIGILFPFVPRRQDRDIMVNTVAPVWDGNETWLVLGGGGLLAGFPFAYSVLLSALYIPLVLMLTGLILRGVAFEFRFKADEAHRPFWSRAFAFGSYTAAFFQGAALGAFIYRLQGDRSVLSRRRAGLAVGIQRLYRVRGDRRLRAARQHLADDEDRGPVAGAHDRRRAVDHTGAAGRDRHRQPVDSAGARADRRAMVHRAQHLLLSRQCRSWWC